MNLEEYLKPSYKNSNRWRHERVIVRELASEEFESINQIICDNWYELTLKSCPHRRDPLLCCPTFQLNGKYIWLNFNTIYFSDKEDFVKAVLML